MFNVPPNTLKVISVTGFYGSNDPTNSVKALKEDRSYRLGFNPNRSTPVKWAQCDKTQSREL